MDEVKTRPETIPTANVTENPAVIKMSAELKEISVDALTIFANGNASE